MKLTEFNSLVGTDSYVLCQGKERVRKGVVNIETADRHLFSGGTVGWWVTQGYVVVDIDEGKEQALAMIKELGIKTLVCETNKGLHLYFRTSKEPKQGQGMTLPSGLKCDTRAAGKGYVLLPFGVDGRRFNKVREIAELPVEFTPIPHRKDSLLGLKEGGGRNELMFKQLMAYKNFGANEDQIETMSEVINKIIFGEPMINKELRKIVDNVHAYEASTGGDNPYLIYNQKGVPTQVNARAVKEHFVDRGDTFVQGKTPFQYEGGIYIRAELTIYGQIEEMIGVDSLISDRRIMECYNLLIKEKRLQKGAEDFNNDKHLINFQNGVWNTETQELLPHDPKYMQTIQIPRNLGEKIGEWEDTKIYKFLSDKCLLDEDDINMIADFMAYTLALDNGLKAFMVLYGPSNTGKSVLINFMENIVGRNNVSSVTMAEFNERFRLADLHNKLLNTSGDDSANALSNVATVKKITSTDTVYHEKKHEHGFYFKNFAKLIFSFNQLPLQLEEKSDAYYQRIRILHMDKALKLDKEYVEELWASVDEALPHLLDRLPLRSIPRSEKSDVLVESLRSDSDTIHAFITEKCSVGAKYVASTKGFYESYLKYCMDNGREPHKKHSFGRHMESQGFRRTKHSETRETVWKGVSLKGR